jgi:CO dehydrogenase/acetyl-CoA synthase delta subunit
MIMNKYSAVRNLDINMTTEMNNEYDYISMLYPSNEVMIAQSVWWLGYGLDYRISSP